ncbi:type II/IV secretion system protein [Candidatus Pacearchaeota archaeon]|nr:type II/IV secretion system protein [Candidatus Pacearchaeota archaeon]
MATEQAFIERADIGLKTLDDILLKIEKFPVKVEPERNTKVKYETRPDHFARESYQSLAKQKGILPLICRMHEKELIVGVRDDSSQVTEDRTSIHFMDIQPHFDLLLPTAYRLARIGTDQVIPIILENEEYDYLHNIILSPEKRAEISKKREHHEVEVKFDYTVNPEARNILRQVYRRAFSFPASDIHFEFTERGPRVRYRVNDLLQVDPLINPDNPVEKTRVDNETFVKVVAAIKIDAGDSGINMAEHRKKQTGAFDFDKINWKQGDVEVYSREELPHGHRARVSILPSIFGENTVLRLLEKGRLFTLGNLGFSLEDVAKFESLCTQPEGIIISTGPTGSGKTTTLNALLQHSNTPAEKIITIENPVEYVIDGIQQCQVSSSNSFDEILEELLRHDPDTAMLGEIRNEKTARVAIELASTGHLTYVTLHTNDAFGAFPRLRQMGISYPELREPLKAVFAQRLVRTLCPDCKVPDPRSDINSLFRNPLFNKGVVCYTESKYGCDNCKHTGVSGRSAVTEIWEITDEVGDLIDEGVVAGTKYIGQAVRDQNMRPIAMSALDQVVAGKISLKEVVRVMGARVYRNREKLFSSLIPPHLARG